MWKSVGSHPLRNAAFWLLLAFIMVLESGNGMSQCCLGSTADRHNCEPTLSLFNGYLLWRVTKEFLPTFFIYLLEFAIFSLALANAFYYLVIYLKAMYDTMKAELFVGSVKSSTEMDSSALSAESIRRERISPLCTFMGNYFKQPVPIPNELNLSLSSTLSEMDVSSLSSLVGYQNSPSNKTVSSVHSFSQLNQIQQNETCDSIIDPKDCSAYFSFNFSGATRLYQPGTPQYLLTEEDTAISGIRSFIDEHKLTKYSRRPDKRLFQRTRADDSPKVRIVTELKEILDTYGLREQHLEVYEIKLRIWFCNTILRPLVAKIDEVNAELDEKCPSLHLKLGISTMETLLMHKQHFSNTFLPFVLPYLRVHSNQQYVVSRLRTLSQNIALEEFKWNGGGEQTMRDESDSFDRLISWGQQLPTDAELICHLFCTYLDFHILPSSDGVSSELSKPFTNVFFVRLSDGKFPLALMQMHASKQQMKQQNVPDDVADEKYFIRITSTRPPTFELIVDGGETIILPCKNEPQNFWLVLILFLAHITKMSHARLGHIHLSSLSLNIFDE